MCLPSVYISCFCDQLPMMLCLRGILIIIFIFHVKRYTMIMFSFDNITPVYVVSVWLVPVSIPIINQFHDNQPFVPTLFELIMTAVTAVNKLVWLITDWNFSLSQFCKRINTSHFRCCSSFFIEKVRLARIQYWTVSWRKLARLMRIKLELGG